MENYEKKIDSKEETNFITQNMDYLKSEIESQTKKVNFLAKELNTEKEILENYWELMTDLNKLKVGNLDNDNSCSFMSADTIINEKGVSGRRAMLADLVNGRKSNSVEIVDRVKEIKCDCGQYHLLIRKNQEAGGPEWSLSHEEYFIICGLKKVLIHEENDAKMY